MKRHRDFSRFNPLATVRIKWGVVGDGIAVSWVKKRRDRPRENERPTTHLLSHPEYDRVQEGKKDDKFSSVVLFDSAREKKDFSLFFFQRSRYRLKLDRYRSDDLGDELFAQRNKDLDGRKNEDTFAAKRLSREALRCKPLSLSLSSPHRFRHGSLFA